MREKVDRKAKLAPPGSEREKFFERPGLISVNLGPEGIDEKTAKKLNQLMKDIDAGKVKEGIPEKVLERDKRLKMV
ncbi:MAG: hypothetical protein PHC97_01620 [Patescibacteria group bacterium]|nr:hypothetical protein [Patescibacteria group bacterium]